ncbi:MAG: hypothetical protein DDG59_15230 [Anaerolineae bacterium]|jgi:hypothetical protein|nr:MAG: hypothetical protein DDG59_15230 [Anaerolineae bacterium]
MPASLKAPCRSCHSPYLTGKDGICLACLRGSQPIGLRCACGEAAVTVLLDQIGLNGEYAVEIPLCAACLALELETWEEKPLQRPRAGTADKDWQACRRRRTAG